MATTDRPPVTTKRQYRSRLREEQAAGTRRAILDAARDELLARGWAATGMRDVAVAAGVSPETVYKHFSSKRGLLQAVADEAVVGDDAPVALADRDEFRALGRGRRPARIRAAARLLTEVHVRTIGVARLLREAAPTDSEIGEMLHATRERQRVDVGAALALVVGRPPNPTELDGVWAVASPEVYLLLVEQSGWTAQQYEDWIADTFERVIPRS